MNYEGLRRAAVDPMTDTVPTAEEASGDFSNSGVNIYDPNSTYANPTYNPSLPVSSANPQYLRKQFQYNGRLNVIPPSELNSASQIMLQNYVPQPNQMSGMSMGMNMNGQPTVVGAGNDSNNYLDLRNELHYTDQGSVRVDHDFSNGSTTLAVPTVGRASMGSCRKTCRDSGTTTTTWRNRECWGSAKRFRRTC